MHKPNFAGAFFFGALGLFAAGVVALLGYETYALEAGKEPITWKVRRTSKEQPGAYMLAALLLGILAGHLFWGERHEPGK